MYEAQFRCWWNYGTYLNAANSQHVRFIVAGKKIRDVVGLSEFQPSTPLAIEPNGPVNFACDVTKHFTVDWRPKGSSEISRLSLESVNLKIEAIYKTRFLFWLVPRSYISDQFEWGKTPTGYHWIAGPVVTYKN